MKTIVCIDADIDNGQLVKDVLETTSLYHVVLADTGGVGVKATKEHHASLVLLELDLPDIHGIDLITRIKGDPACKDIPIVVVSATVESSEIRRAQAAGITAFVEKPYDVKRLKRKVASILEG